MSTQLAPMEDMMQPNGSQVAILHRISNIVSSDLTLDRMLQELVGLTLQVTACDACLVYLMDQASGEIVLRASQLPHDAEIGRIRLKMGEGITRGESFSIVNHHRVKARQAGDFGDGKRDMSATEKINRGRG